MASYHIAPIGEFIHPWINKPDTKFNDEGLFHVDVRIGGKEAEELAAKIEASAQAALDVHTQEMKPGEAKKWELYLPFTREEDDETGEPTGFIIFDFKQNAKIKSKKEPSGFKNVRIEIQDSKTNPIDVAVWSGSEGRVMFSMRPITLVSSKKAGVRLDFAKVQVTKLQQGSSQGFGEVEDGYVGDTSSQSFGDAEDDQGGDY